MKSFVRTIALVTIFLLTAAFHGPCNVPNICGEQLNPLPYNYEYAVLGDSIFAFYTGECQNVACRLSLSLGERIHSEAVSGARLSAHWETEAPLPNNRKRPTAVEKQFELAQIHAAKAQKKLPYAEQKKITTVIIDGGANETILEADGVCKKADSSDPGCAAHIARIAQDLSELIDTMKQNGVKKIVYSGYYRLQEGYTYYDFSEALMDLNTTIAELIEVKNEEDGIEVIFVDQQHAFDGDDCVKLPDCPESETCYDHYLSADKLHPSPHGAEKLAENIYNALIPLD